MPSAKDVYNAFTTQQARQDIIIESVKREQKETIREFESSSESLERAVAGQFPTVDSFPLPLMTAASRLQGAGFGRDYVHLVQSLRADDTRNRVEQTKLVSQHGMTDALGRQITALDQQIATQAQTLAAVSQNIAPLTRKLKTQEERQALLSRHKEKFDVAISDSNAPIYTSFSLAKWVFNEEWRHGRNAIKDFKKRGGKSIDKGNEDIEQQEAEAKALAKIAAEATALRDAQLLERTRLQKVQTAINQLDSTFMGEGKIHATLTSTFAGLLQAEESAKFLGKALPQAQAEPLMLEALKHRNLHVIYDNLEQLRVQAEAAAGKAGEPIKKLKEVARRAPTKSIDFDLEVMETQFGAFNAAAEGYLGQARNARQTLRDFPETYRRKSDQSSTTSSSDDTYLIMNNMLMQQMWFNAASANSTAVHSYCPPSSDATASPHAPATGSIPAPDGAASAASGPHSAAPTAPHFATPSFHAPSLTGSLQLPSLDAGSISVPTIDSGHHGGGSSGGGGHSSGYDGGGYSSGGGGYDGGGGGGGGCDGGGGGGCMITMIEPSRPSRKMARVKAVRLSA